jgi:hypothetical protein
MRPHASMFVTLGMATLAVLVLAALSLAVGRYTERGRRGACTFALGSLVWLVATGLLAASGALVATDTASPSPPPIMPLFGLTLLLTIGLAASSLGRELARRAPLPALVGLHVFRLPLELVMHEAAREGTMPRQMSLSGLNFDVVTGLCAMAVSLALASGRAPRWLAVAFNALGTALLLVIMAIGIASLPRFHAFGEEPEQLNTWVSHPPFVWLPCVLVASALFGHVVLWRKLLDARHARGDDP